jgi:energy-coupling factor transporter ATP-binding protein EcfA2
VSTTFPLPPFPRASWERQSSAAPFTGDRELGRLSEQAPRISWGKFAAERFQWMPGEHVGLIGPTGQGKTTLLLNILPLHEYVTVFATKPRDATMDRLVATGYQKLSRWYPLDPRSTPRRVIWPDASRIDSMKLQREVFSDAFARIYREGGWTVGLDEVRFIVSDLGLKQEVNVFLLQGRSLGISLVAATQRPRFIPTEVYDQSTHLFFWRDNDAANLQRVSELNAPSAPFIRRVIGNLERFQVLYVNSRTGEMLRTRAPALEESAA